MKSTVHVLDIKLEDTFPHTHESYGLSQAEWDELRKRLADKPAEAVLSAFFQLGVLHAQRQDRKMRSVRAAHAHGLRRAAKASAEVAQ
jgi:predicted patatin/cPLA2 family phospholipase